MDAGAPDTCTVGGKEGHGRRVVSAMLIPYYQESRRYPWQTYLLVGFYSVIFQPPLAARKIIRVEEKLVMFGFHLTTVHLAWGTVMSCHFLGISDLVSPCHLESKLKSSRWPARSDSHGISELMPYCLLSPHFLPVTLASWVPLMPLRTGCFLYRERSSPLNPHGRQTPFMSLLKCYLLSRAHSLHPSMPELRHPCINFLSQSTTDWVALNNRTLLSHHSGDQKPPFEVLTGLFPPGGSEGGCDGCLSPPSCWWFRTVLGVA